MVIGFQALYGLLSPETAGGVSTGCGYTISFLKEKMLVQISILYYD